MGFDFLLTEPEKENFSHYTEEIEDNSISSKILSPLWEAIANLVPGSVAPNVLSLAGLLCTIQAFYLCLSYMTSNPRLVCVAAGLLGMQFSLLLPCCVG